MVACLSKSIKGGGLQKPDTLVLLLLVAWWVVNLVQAAVTGLANDEAYYWYFSQHLDWGYFDHPPLVALLVRLSSWIPGALGIRFCATLLQPLYLWLFWCLIRPSDATRGDALLYLLLCFSQPLLQLYGFMALPDAPLMFSAVLFWWSFKHFVERDSWPYTLLLGLAVALLGYSKYHGVLVVAFAVLACPKVLLRPKFYASMALTLLLFLPHLWWQYEHDWVSLCYHLVGRNAWGYKFSFTTEYLLLLLTIFNPLWLYHYGKGMVQGRRLEVPMRSEWLWTIGGFVLFFLVATRHGHVQPQWLLPIVLPLTALLFYAVRSSRYARIVGWVCMGLFLLVRIVAVANPFGLKGELWNQRQVYTQIAEMAGDRPVQFMQNYTAPAKYTYYTGREAYCCPYFFSRDSQWQFDTADRAYHGREVVVGNLNNNNQRHQLDLADGHTFHYTIVPNYQPLRELRVQSVEPLAMELPYLYRSDTLDVADSLPPVKLTLRICNPYAFDICPDSLNPLRVTFFMHTTQYEASGFSTPLVDTLRAHDTTYLTISLPPISDLPDGTHAAGFSIGYRAFSSASNSRPFNVEVRNRRGEKLSIRQVN